MRTISKEDIEQAAINNQLTLSGASPEFIEANAIIFLEYVEYTANSLVVKNGAGEAKSGTLVGTILNLTKAPLRLEGGVILTGAVTLAKLFYIK